MVEVTVRLALAWCSTGLPARTTHSPAPIAESCPVYVLPGVVGYLEAEFAALQRSKDATIRTLEPRVGGPAHGIRLCGTHMGVAAQQ